MKIHAPDSHFLICPLDLKFTKFERILLFGIKREVQVLQQEPGSQLQVCSSFALFLGEEGTAPQNMHFSLFFFFHEARCLFAAALKPEATP